jgi:hypothetical protein
MKKLGHLLIMCFLMVMLPAQGVAAASMRICGPEHHQTMPAGQHHVGGENTTGATTTATIQASDAHHTPEQLTSLTSLNKEKCSSCATCCVGAVLFSPAIRANAISFSAEKIDLSLSSYSGHIGNSLERPPRV